MCRGSSAPASSPIWSLRCATLTSERMSVANSGQSVNAVRRSRIDQPRQEIAPQIYNRFYFKNIVVFSLLPPFLGSGGERRFLFLKWNSGKRAQLGSRNCSREIPAGNKWCALLFLNEFSKTPTIKIVLIKSRNWVKNKTRVELLEFIQEIGMWIFILRT